MWITWKKCPLWVWGHFEKISCHWTLHNRKSYLTYQYMGWVKNSLNDFSVNQDPFLFTTTCTADVERILIFRNGYITILSDKSPVDKQNSKIKFVSKSFFDVYNRQFLPTHINYPLLLVQWHVKNTTRHWQSTYTKNRVVMGNNIYKSVVKFV